MITFKKSLIVSLGLLITINSHASWYYPGFAQRAVTHIKRHKAAYGLAAATAATVATTTLLLCLRAKIRNDEISSKKTLIAVLEGEANLTTSNEDYAKQQKKEAEDRAKDILHNERWLPNDMAEALEDEALLAKIDAEIAARDILREEYKLGDQSFSDAMQPLIEEHNACLELKKHVHFRPIPTEIEERHEKANAEMAFCQRSWNLFYHKFRNLF
jgi:hypothetical protein